MRALNWILLLGVGVASCTMPAEPDEAPAQGAEATLTVDHEATLTRGTFAREGGLVTFAAEQSAADTISVRVELHGKTLTADFLGSGQDRSVELDGYLTADGSDVQLTSADQALLAELALALRDQGGNETAAETMLGKALAHWGHRSRERPLSGGMTVKHNTGVTPITRYVYGKQKQGTQHSCNECGCPWYNPYNCCTYQQELDIGRAGHFNRIGDCSFPGTERGEYTQDCLDRYACETGMHMHGSGDVVCQDEVGDMGDDDLLALTSSCVGHCGGQSWGGCYCDEACANYGDCCYNAQDVCVVPAPGFAVYDSTYKTTHGNCPIAWKTDTTYCDKGCQWADTVGCNPNY